MVAKEEAAEEGWCEIGEAGMVVGTVLGAAEEVVRTKNRETKPVVGAVVVVAVGPGRAVVADEEGGGGCSTERFVAGGQMVHSPVESSEGHGINLHYWHKQGAGPFSLLSP